MRSKLVLDLERLSVESFASGAAGEPRGTVEARQDNAGVCTSSAWTVRSCRYAGQTRTPG